MVLEADTIVDPGAVMVEALDTLATDRAMSAATRADCLAVRAQLRRVNAQKHGPEIYVFVL